MTRLASQASPVVFNYPVPSLLLGEQLAGLVYIYTGVASGLGSALP